MKFENIIIIGDGLSANLLALELNGVKNSVQLIADKPSNYASNFSHVFYNRMINELKITTKADKHSFCSMIKKSPLHSLTRASYSIDEVRAAIEEKVSKTDLSKLSGMKLTGAEVFDRKLKTLIFSCGTRINLTESTLVIDCMGRLSPFHAMLNVSKTTSDICYITARQPKSSYFDTMFNPYDTHRVHDRLTTMVYKSSCDDDFLTIFTSPYYKDVHQKYRDPVEFKSLFINTYGAKRINENVTDPRLYLRPAVYQIYQDDVSSLPLNYVAAGDAACATLPNFGSGALLAWKSSQLIGKALVNGLSDQTLPLLWSDLSRMFTPCYLASLEYNFGISRSSKNRLNVAVRTLVPSSFRYMRSIKKASYDEGY